ncbi:MAG: L,D-transpeptidase family protein [Lachnospiraceae bacterium]|nr:L,D-transpeptidase family protein [Lachnospiraceae bacterium]
MKKKHDTITDSQGSLNPQKPADNEVTQGSLDPHDPTVGQTGQGSLNPYDPAGGKEGQGSLDPHGSSSIKQGSLNPRDSSRDSSSRNQGSLISQSSLTDDQRSEDKVENVDSGRADAADETTAAGNADTADETSAAGTADKEDKTSAAGTADTADETTAAESGRTSADITDKASAKVSADTADETTAKGTADTADGTGTEAPMTNPDTEGTESGNTSENTALIGAVAAAAVAATAGGGTDSDSAAGSKDNTAGDSSGTSNGAESAPAPGTGIIPAGTLGGTAGTAPLAPSAPAAEPVSGTDADKKEKKKKKSHSKAIAYWISFLLIVMILGGIYYAGYKYCETHFMPGSTINGFDCGGLTEEEAEKRFADAASKYTLDIHFRGGTTEVLTAQDIGFAYKPDGSIGAMIHRQDQQLWPRYFFEDYAYTMEVAGSYDPNLLASAILALPELQKENMQAPTDAYIMFMDGNETTDGTFEIVPDDPGSTIDPVQLAAGAGDAAARYEQEIDAEQIAGAYKEAKLKADDAGLVARCKDLNDIVGASITYVLPDKTELKLNSDVMKDWLVRDKKGMLVKDDEVWDEQLWKFMELLAYNCNTIGTDREFNSTTRGPITVTGGDYGYMVNQIAEHDLLVEDLAAGKKETRKPSYYISPYNDETENDGIGRSYLEVDLEEQHMWCYIDGKLVMESDCVTGDPTTDHETPTGVFGIMFMKKDATLRGIQQKNGKYEYETKVKYWMPFYADCGFHDAWWRTAFGEEIYKGDGSHGCVNLPSEAAEELFSYCDTKMPVVIYK